MTPAERRAAAEYNTRQLDGGRLAEHVVELVRFWQEQHAGLEVDGKIGPKTIAAIAASVAPASPVRFLRSPLPQLADGRSAVVTSAFRPPERPKHLGIDLFYRWRPGDEPSFVGDKGCAGRTADGAPKWCVPYDTPAVAAAAGVVQHAGPSPSGFRCWIDHLNGWRTGYFHLIDMRVAVGQRVEAGDELGLVGDNPVDHDGRHLHFELSPTSAYAPVDPAPYML